MKATGVVGILVGLSAAMIPTGSRLVRADSQRNVAQLSQKSLAQEKEKPVPFGPGEVVSYDVSWARYLTAGSATVSVQAKKSSFGSMAYHIVAEGRPTSLLSYLYRVYYKADTLLDAYTLLPQRASVYSEEGDERVTRVTRFDQTARTASFELKTTTVIERKLILPMESHDPLSIVYALRAFPMTVGSARTVSLVENGDVYTLRIRTEKRELVSTPVGQRSAWRLVPEVLDHRGSPQGRRLVLWLSDDIRRLPLKMEAHLTVGTFTLSLREARYAK